MAKFGNLILRTERAIAKVALSEYTNADGQFNSFDSACEFFKKLGYSDDKAKSAAADCGLQDGVLCSKVQEGMPTDKPQFQQPVQPAENPNPPQPQQDRIETRVNQQAALEGTAAKPAPSPSKAKDYPPTPNNVQQPPVKTATPTEPAPSTPAIEQPKPAAPAAPEKPVEPKAAPIPPEQKARLDAAKEVMGVTVDDSEMSKAMEQVCKDVWEGDDRGVTAFESRESCLEDAIRNEGMSFDEASDRCDQLSENSDWDDDDVYKNMPEGFRAVVVQDILNKSRATGGEILRVPRDIIAKICPACAERMAKNNIKLLKIRVAAGDGELVAAIAKAEHETAEQREDEGGFFRHCMSHIAQDYDEESRKALCATLHHKYLGRWPGADKKVEKSKDALGHGSNKRVDVEGMKNEREVGPSYNLLDYAEREEPMSVKTALHWAATAGDDTQKQIQKLEGLRDSGMSVPKDIRTINAAITQLKGGVMKSAADVLSEFVAKTKDAKGHGSEKRNHVYPPGCDGLTDPPKEQQAANLKAGLTPRGNPGYVHNGQASLDVPPDYLERYSREWMDQQKMLKEVAQGQKMSELGRIAARHELESDEGGTAQEKAERIYNQERGIKKSASDIVSEFVAKEKDAGGHGSNKRGAADANGNRVHSVKEVHNGIYSVTHSNALNGDRKMTDLYRKVDGKWQSGESHPTGTYNSGLLREAPKHIADALDTHTGASTGKVELPSHGEYQRNQAIGYVFDKLKNDKSESLKRSVLSEAQQKFGMDAEDVVRVKQYFADEYGWDLSTGGVAKSGTSEGVKLSWETRRGAAVAASEKADEASARAKDLDTDASHKAAAEANDAAKSAWLDHDASMILGQNSNKVYGAAFGTLHDEAKAKAMEHGLTADDHRQTLEGRHYDRQDMGGVDVYKQPKLDPERAKEVATTILDQLGGRRFGMMTGAKNFASHPEGALSFRLPGSGGFTKDGINHVKITLTPADTYDIAYGKVRGTTFKVMAEAKDIYAEDLQRNFREHTGLETSMGGVSKVDQRPTEAERNQVISEKWSSDIMDTSALANTPDNVTFTKPENVGIGKAQDIIDQFVSKAGTSEGVKLSWEKRHGYTGNADKDYENKAVQPYLLAGNVADDWANRIGTKKQTKDQGEYDAVRNKLEQHLNDKFQTVYGGNKDFAKKVAPDTEESRDRITAFMHHWAAAHSEKEGHLTHQEAMEGQGDHGVWRDAPKTGESSIGKALGLASAVVMVAKGFADKKCKDCGAKMYYNQLDGDYECPDCDADDIEKAAAEESKYTEGGHFKGPSGTGERFENCEGYMQEKGYSAASAKRICGSIANHVGKNIEEKDEVMNTLRFAQELMKSAELDGSHRIGEPLTAPTGAPGRVGDKPSEQDTMGVEGGANTGAANVDPAAGVGIDDVLGLLCTDCGGNSAKLGVDVDTNGTLSGKDVRKAVCKCSKCGAAVVAKDDDEDGGGDEGGDDIEKTIADFIAKEKDAKGHGSNKRGDGVGMVTNQDTVHTYGGYKKVTIPKGTSVVPATNLPNDSSIKYWVHKLPPNLSNNDEIDSHHRNYGFGIGADEVDGSVAKSAGLLGRITAIVKTGGQV